MPRKTITIDRVRDLANAMLVNSADKMDREREGIAELLVSILHDTDNYHGYQHAGHPGPHEFDPASGVWRDANGAQIDDTRRWYY